MSHNVILPNGRRATLMARATGTGLVIVKLYLQESDGSFRPVALPTTDPAALQVIEYVRSQGIRLQFGEETSENRQNPAS